MLYALNKLGGGTSDTNLDAGIVSCKVCDPTVQTCYCALTTQCIEASSVCTGRAITTCLGAGARCLPARSKCSTSGGDPPQLVGTGANGALEPRCQYVDDVCCPGVFDLGTPDLGPDLSVPDLSSAD